jgi:hypothetical protein
MSQDETTPPPPNGGNGNKRGGVRLGPDGRPLQGRKPGVPNRATLEREAEARLGMERERLLLEAKAAEGERAIKEAAAQGRKLMKHIGFDLAHLFAGLAAFYQPYPQWRQDPASGKAVNANPNFDERKFREYAKLAAETARDFAGYESPKLSAVLVGSAVVTDIEVTGGLPDEQDGGLIDAAANAPGDAARDPAPDAEQGDGGAADVPPEAGGAVPDAGQAQGGPVRKAVG